MGAQGRRSCSFHLSQPSQTEPAPNQTGCHTKPNRTTQTGHQTPPKIQIAGALAALEAYHPPILHRDVKPSNIFLDGAGRARLGDFGLARLLPASAATLTGETGTYLYMAPEMIRWGGGLMFGGWG